MPIHHGDLFDVLPRLPAQSVHCVVTSPPYWGLRDYGNPPRVIGGEPDCDHEWSEHQRAAGANSVPVRDAEHPRAASQAVGQLIVVSKTCQRWPNWPCYCDAASAEECPSSGPAGTRINPVPRMSGGCGTCGSMPIMVAGYAMCPNCGRTW